HGVALAQRLDPETGALTGQPVAVSAAVGGTGSLGYRNFVAAAGTLAWWTVQPPLVQLTWLDRSGTAVGWLGTPGRYAEFKLSPDDRRLAAVVRENDHGSAAIWIVDAASGARQRLDSDPSPEWSPLWQGDAKHVAFLSYRGVGGNGNLYSAS